MRKPLSAAVRGPLTPPKNPPRLAEARHPSRGGRGRRSAGEGGQEQECKACPPTLFALPPREGGEPPANRVGSSDSPELGDGGRSVGHAWRLSSRHAVAYLRDAALAGELLAAEPRHLARAAMAVYYDRKGKAFAWQVRFDAARWEEVVGRLR